MNDKKQQNFTRGLFAVYVCILAWLILFKFQIDLTKLSRMRNINLIPFQASVIVNGKLEIREIIWNVLVFVPFGIYLSMLKPEWSLLKKVLFGFLLSFIFEVLQYVFAIGASDITDIIGNTFGGMIGVLFYFILQKMWKDKAVRIVNILACIVIALFVVLFGILLIANS